MNITVTKEEATEDLRRTDLDVERLMAITSNLRAFIQESFGEDRGNFRICLMKCETALDQGLALQRKIKAFVENK